jgi:hypothetical protein
MDFFLFSFILITSVVSLSVTQLHGDMSAQESVNPIVVCRATCMCHVQVIVFKGLVCASSISLDDNKYPQNSIP